MKASKIFALCLTLLAVPFLVSGLSPNEATAAYPEKPVALIVPFGAGGGFDLLARTVAVRLEKELGVAVVVKNQGGAGGRRGSIALFKSKPDGYRIGFFHFVPFFVDQFLFGKKPSIDYRELEIVLKLAHNHHFVFVSKESPLKSLSDIKKLGRPLKASATGIGNSTWVAVNALGMGMGFPVKFVTGYASMTTSALAVAKGEVEASTAAFVQIQGLLDDLRPLCILARKRSSRLPEVPSIKELGYPKLGFLGTPYAVVAPPGMAKEHIAVIRKALYKVLDEPGFVKWLDEKDYFSDPMEPRELWDSLQIVEDTCKSLRPLVEKSK
jgi:tripartite-type tricarboxylate transporter receptor subunit TctC